jgi:DNA-binding MarR family transcriptional regulator
MLLRRVGHELGRELATTSLFFHTLVAGKIGLNATDTRCLDILARSGSVAMTAGSLTAATGLTTGAITGILDRLERAGFLKRVKDAQDRRKVLIELVPGEMAKLGQLYDGLGARMEELARQYTVAELQMIEGFLSANLHILSREIARLTASSSETDDEELPMRAGNTHTRQDRSSINAL